MAQNYIEKTLAIQVMVIVPMLLEDKVILLVVATVLKNFKLSKTVATAP